MMMMMIWVGARRKRSWRIVNWLAGHLQLRLTHHYNHDHDHDEDYDDDYDDGDGGSYGDDDDGEDDEYWCEVQIEGGTPSPCT